MEDIIDIIVTETTNTIEITSQSTDEVIDVNIIDNREDITLNVTPTVVEININSLTGSFGVAWGDITGTLSAQTDLNTALGLKADLVGGKVPSSQLPSYVDDVVEVANYAALPATGETGKIYITLDTNYIYRWTGSTYVEIKDSSAVWGAITGTLSSQTDLQNALNAKFNNPTGDSTQYLNGVGTPVTFPVAGQSGTLVREVRNTTGATLTKGTIVYISGATGNKPTVSKAIATGDSTSAQTFGMCQADISNNSNGYVVCVGDITGLDTSAVSEGVQLYLSSTTAGTYTTTKQVAPAHLVYIGVVTRSHPTQGQIEVKIQNGYELDEIHDVLITSKANNDGLFYESSTSLWKNKSIATVLGYTPEQPLTFNSPLSRSTNTVSIPAATSSANGYLTSTDWSTFNGKQTALNGTGFVKASGTTISYDNTSYLPTTGGTIGGQLNISNTGAATALYIDQTNGSYHAASFNNSGGGSALYIGGTATFVGTINCTSSITGSSIVKSGGTSSQFLKADGSVDSSVYLTTGTASSTYLAKTGGTLTGALSGTSATFSDTITSSLAGQSARGLYFTANQPSGINWYDTDDVEQYSMGIIANSGNGYWGLWSSTSSTAIDRSTATPIFKIARTGAATFSSSVTANGYIYINTVVAGTPKAIQSWNVSGPNYGTWYDLGTNDNKVGFGGSTTIGGIPSSPLLVYDFSNNRVGIGTTSPAEKLTVIGKGYFQPYLPAVISGASGYYGTNITLASDIGATQGANRIWSRYDGSGSPAISIEVSTNSQGYNSDPQTLTYSEIMRIKGNGNVGIGNGASYAPYLLTLNVTGGGQQIGGIDNSNGASLGFIQFNAGSMLLNARGNGDANNMIFTTGGSERMRITSGGKVMVGTTDSGPNALLFASRDMNGPYPLGAKGESTAQGLIGFFDNGNTVIGSITKSGSVVSYNVTSDYRLKQDFKSIKGLEIVNKINVYNYEWKSDKTRMDGVIAHELQEVLPYAVTGVKDGEQMQSVDYSKIVPVAIKAIQETDSKVVQLEKKIVILEAEIQTLKNK